MGMKSLEWALVQYDWCSCKASMRRKTDRHSERMAMGESGREALGPLLFILLPPEQEGKTDSSGVKEMA